MAGKKTQVIYCGKITDSKLKIYLASSSEGAVAVGISITDDRDAIEYLKERFPEKKLYRDDRHTKNLAAAVRLALEGKPCLNDLALDINCTSFQQRVLEATARIPFGRVKTYGDIAKLAGSPKGARAVGQVMNKNPLPIIFPCHRVIASNGPGGFSGGLELKEYLLERERQKLRNLEGEKFS